ncbi:CDKN2AIP N-terminal-like protein isoform X3 [Sinocyclocheilus grahami]|uniref:XRN2-binding (XTBD) domain-containing protein n=1 Tax=Sinocyclocheilus grahami TaxID=75366 RepID=A0A672RCW5_SINGR|nr:PREDICTED: CDKN2AIP N-terminal-like protein isoform X3 [Sinocyclocheilus grahami]
MAATDVEDFIGQNRQLSDLVETFRSVSESEKHWKSRREFIFRNINDYEDPHLDQLLALSMVWANHVFLGCRGDACTPRVVLAAASSHLMKEPEICGASPTCNNV